MGMQPDTSWRLETERWRGTVDETLKSIRQEIHREFENADQNRKIAAEEMTRRLGGMNEVREQLTAQAALLATKASVEAVALSVEQLVKGRELLASKESVQAVEARVQDLRESRAGFSPLVQGGLFFLMAVLGAVLSYIFTHKG